jgi:hypothetical protein
MRRCIEYTIFVCQLLLIVVSVIRNMIDPIAVQRRRRERAEKAGTPRIIFCHILRSLGASVVLFAGGYFAELSYLWYALSLLFIFSASMQTVGYTTHALKNLPLSLISPPSQPLSDTLIKKRAARIMGFQIIILVLWCYSWRHLFL